MIKTSHDTIHDMQYEGCPFGRFAFHASRSHADLGRAGNHDKHEHKERELKCICSDSESKNIKASFKGLKDDLSSHEFHDSPTSHHYRLYKSHWKFQDRFPGPSIVNCGSITSGRSGGSELAPTVCPPLSSILRLVAVWPVRGKIRPAVFVGEVVKAWSAADRDIAASVSVYVVNVGWLCSCGGW